MLQCITFLCSAVIIEIVCATSECSQYDSKGTVRYDFILLFFLDCSILCQRKWDSNFLTYARKRSYSTSSNHISTHIPCCSNFIFHSINKNKQCLLNIMSIMLLRLRAFGMTPIVYTERLTGMTKIMSTTNNDNFF